MQHSANAPKKPELISHAIVLFEIDCSRKLLKDFFTAVYDKNGDAVYCSIKGNVGPWKSIPPDTSEESLEKIACSISSAPIKAKSINNVKTPSIALETSGHLSALTAFSPINPNLKIPNSKLKRKLQFHYNMAAGKPATWKRIRVAICPDLHPEE